MKPTIYRRVRRHPATREAASFNKEKQQEQAFFGETSQDPFFKSLSAVAQVDTVNRKCADCEKEDKVQRSPDKKEEEKNVLRVADNKEEEKAMKKEDKKEEEKIQKKETATVAANTSTTASNYISSINSKGQTMDAGVQSFYENRMRTDFSDVKIHTDKEAAESANEINAQAYTYGNHIVFNEGKYQPQSSDGKHLLAHELAHVVQNNGPDKMHRQPNSPNPEWLSKEYQGDLPGEKLNIMGPYTENDKSTMKGILMQRIEYNRKNITKYVSGLVNGTIRILGEFMLVEMNKAAQEGMSGFGKNIKFIIGETAQFIAAGGVGYIAKAAMRPAVTAGLKFIADKTTGKLADSIGDSLDENIKNEKIEEKQKFLTDLLGKVADQTSTTIEQILPEMGQNEGDYREWLATAPLEELHRFAIPEAFPPIDTAMLNAIIAGQIARTASKHTYSEGILGEKSHHMSPNEYDIPDAAHYMDDNIIIAHATPYTVKDIQFYSYSKVLTENIVGKIPVGALHNIPLIVHLISDRKIVNAMASKFLTALWGYKPSINEIEVFHDSFISVNTPIILRRNKSGQLVVSEGGSVADALWLYAMATGDYSFQSLAEEIQQWQEGENNMYQDQLSSSFTTVGQAAKKLAMYMPMFYEKGGKIFIESMVNNKLPQMPENRYSDAYWEKDNRVFFKGRRPMAYYLY
jgi:hypothetical protein